MKFSLHTLISPGETCTVQKQIAEYWNTSCITEKVLK